MAEKREERNSGGRDLQARLTALAGLVVIVGSAAAILFAVGVLGGQGGGTTATGIKIENVLLLDTPPAPGLEGLGVEAKEGRLAPDFEISGDREQLFRVFQNIARNALEAMDYDGAFTVTARRAGAWHRIELADDGPGLPQRAIDNLFQAFAGSARHGGTGLGLANARELVRAHGGELELVKSDADGATFAVSLPAG